MSRPKFESSIFPEWNEQKALPADAFAPGPKPEPKKATCPTCGRKVKFCGLNDHIRDVHVKPKHPRDPASVPSPKAD